MRSFSLRLALFGLALMAFTQGCNRGTDVAVVKKAGDPASKEKGAKLRLAFISNNIFEFWTFAQRGAEKAGADLGAEIEFKMPPNGKAEEQQQFIEDLLTKGIQGIAISPNDAENMVDFFRLKVGKRVPLLTVDSDVPDASVRRAYLGTHNYRAGRAVGELIEKAVPEGGKIAIFVGTMDVTNAVERRQGVLDYLSGLKNKEMGRKTPADARDLKVGKYTLVDTRTDDKKPTACQELAEDLLLKTPDIVAVVGLWAYNPPALLRAIEKSKKKIAIIGFDEDAETLEGIKNGKIVGTVVQSPFEFGNQSMRILAALARGDEAMLKNYPGIEADNRIFIPHRVITKDNVVAFEAEVKKILGK